MADAKLCEWLLNNADIPIRYRVTRELLKDDSAAKEIEKELIGKPIVIQWLKNLKPDTPPQHHSMEHGSFDFCLENALVKAAGLGLHSGLPQLRSALGYYIDKIESAELFYPFRNLQTGFNNILISNLLSLAGVNNVAATRFMLSSLDEMYSFVQKGDYNIYCGDDEKSALKGIPAIWRDRKFIKPEIVNKYGYCYPLLYDLIGLHTLYELSDEKINEKINAVIDFISTDEYHDITADGYGIITSDGKKYYSMGWDAKYPGWYNIAEYLRSPNAPRLLFFAQFVAKYPRARRTKWFKELLLCLENYRTGRGTYQFPPGWLKEKQGYAVMGSHLSFGENRRSKQWCEIESTFFVQILNGAD